MRVLIDAANRDDPHGTGVATYARTLSPALSQLGHSVCWLSGATAPTKPSPLFDEVSLWDKPEPVRGVRQKLQTAQRMIGGLTPGAPAIRAVPLTGVVLDARQSDYYLAPDVYTRAHYRHMITRRFTTLKVPAGVDVFHLSTPLPLYMSGALNVVTIHDLVPIRLPNTTPDNNGEFIARARASAKRADLILTVSEASKADIVSLLNINPERVAITYQSSDLEPLTSDEYQSLPGVLRRFGLVEANYILFTGALEPKKNVRRLIEAFSEIDSEMPLVIAGRRAWLWEREIQDLQASLSEAAAKRIRFLGYVTREDLRRLYTAALAFAFPSLYEGFGLPVLDALRFGVPTLTSYVASLPEVAGEAALYIDPFSRDSIRGGLLALMSDQALRQRLSAAGLEQAKRYSFAAYVQRLGDAYARLAR